MERPVTLSYFGLKLGTTSDVPLLFPHNLLSNHVLISGQTGSGKTRLGMMLAVKAENHVSQTRTKLLIVDVEGEWKNIIPQLKNDTKYFSVDRNLRINPFDLKDPALIRDLMRETVFKGIEKEYVDLSAQMNFVLQDTISESKNMEELIHNIKNYNKQKLTALEKTKTALLVRLNPFMQSPLKEIFFCKKSNPNFARIDETNVIIDLHSLDSLVAYKKELRLIYNTISVYFLRKMLNRGISKCVSNLFVADEAQLLVPKILHKMVKTESWPATEFATRLRKRGCGLLLMTQSPSNLESDIIKNSGTKFSFRLQDREDVKLISDSTGFVDIVEFEYISDKFARLSTKNVIVTTTNHEPFLMTVDDFEPEQFVPSIAPEQTVEFVKEEKLGKDEKLFLEFINNNPFLSVRDRRSLIGWDSTKYSNIVNALLKKGVIQKVQVRLGRGTPRILYQKSGSIPGIRHEFYVNWICEKLKERGFNPKTNVKEGPDIEIPESSTAIEIEMGKSNVEANVLRDSHNFKRVIVCSDQIKALDGLSRQIRDRTVIITLIRNVPALFDKIQATKQ